jgi:hypothetical protein
MVMIDDRFDRERPMISRAVHLPHRFLVVWFMLFLVGCTQGRPTSLDRPGGLSQQIEIVALENGDLPSGQFSFLYETDWNGRLRILRARERLDKVIKGEKSEFGQLVKLMDWTNRQWDAGVPDPYPPWEAGTILDEIRQHRTKGFCAQYAVVFLQSCLALGCQARYVDLVDLFGEGRPTHFTVEVWSNEYKKWVVMDPSYNVYYQRDGVPLNVLDLSMAIQNGTWQEIRMVKGKSSRGLRPTDLQSMIAVYQYFEIDLRNDHLSHPQRMWVRNDGALDWSDRYDYYAVWSSVPIPVDPGYHAPKYSEHREDFYWPVNLTHMTFTMGARPLEVMVELKTYTPNFRTFLVKHPDGKWTPVPATFPWEVSSGINELEVKAVNNMGVAGAPAKVKIKARSGMS